MTIETRIEELRSEINECLLTKAERHAATVEIESLKAELQARIDQDIDGVPGF